MPDVFVLVTTNQRDVFFGRVPEFPTAIPAEIELADARMCVYWSAEEHGVFGLAAVGPGDLCRISSAVPKLRLNGITAIAQCSPEAAERWEVGPWAK